MAESLRKWFGSEHQIGAIMRRVGRPKQEGISRDTAEALKKSALDLMSRSGYRTVTIKDIGREAGLTTAMIYYHFHDKDDLLHATIEYAIETALEYYTNTSRDVKNPAKLIHEWLHMHVALQPEIGKVLKLILEYRNSESQNDRVDKIIERFYGSERTVITESIMRGRALGIFRDGHDPAALSDLVSTFLDGAVMRKRVFSDYDIAASVGVFEQMLWSTLGYSGSID
ncbi:TetR/AcrR family transcriptional regulator [Marivita sp.]|jgi:AcrR family transcriptional regulator|uniref:TetR/AcrR family transcriptional regulator n=1 Tax=Marivita sp. TaxID=2003365 RepID=UPI002605A416|nr:TetR/AcrR family transcriptional regulator [Marivita sp.]